MTHEEFMKIYDKSLQHGWVTSKDASVAAKQKERERQYNHEYYQKHSDKWKKRFKEHYLDSKDPGVNLYDGKGGGRYYSKTTRDSEIYEKSLKKLEDTLADLERQKKAGTRDVSDKYLDELRYRIKATKQDIKDLHQSESELASRAQMESAARRRNIINTVKYRQQTATTAEKILDKADVAFETVRRKTSKGAKKVKKLLSDNKQQIAAIGISVALGILSGGRVITLPGKQNKKRQLSLDQIEYFNKRK